MSSYIFVSSGNTFLMAPHFLSIGDTNVMALQVKSPIKQYGDTISFYKEECHTCGTILCHQYVPVFHEPIRIQQMNNSEKLIGSQRMKK